MVGAEIACLLTTTLLVYPSDCLTLLKNLVLSDVFTPWFSDLQWLQLFLDGVQTFFFFLPRRSMNTAILTGALFRGLYFSLPSKSRGLALLGLLLSLGPLVEAWAPGLQSISFSCPRCPVLCRLYTLLTVMFASGAAA